MPEQGTHFWYITIQWANANGTTTAGSYMGTRSPGRKDTGLDVYNSIRTEIGEREPSTLAGVVIAFDVQRNKL